MATNLCENSDLMMGKEGQNSLKFERPNYDSNIIDKATSNVDTRDLEIEGQGRSGFKMLATLSGRERYTLILITLAVCLASVSFSLLAPFYPTEATKKGMDISIVGIVFGTYQGVIFFTAPIFGNYLVKLGPKFTFVAGVFVAGSCNILFGILQYCPAGTPFIVMSIVVRSVEALGFAGFITSSYAIVSSTFKDNVAFTFSILNTGSGAGFMVGPTIGGALYETGGFGLPLYVAGIAVLLNGAAVYKFLPSIEELPAKRKGSMFTLLRSPMVFIPLCSVVVVTIGITTIESTIALHVEPLNLSPVIIGLLFGALSLVNSVTSLIWGYISDTKNIQSPLIIGGHLVLGIGFLLLGPSIFLPFITFNLATILPGLTCIGVSLGCVLVPTIKCMVIGAIETGFENNIDTYALVSGLFNSLQTLGGFIGPVGVTYLVQRFDFPIAYTIVGMSSLFMMLVSIIFFAVRKFKFMKRKSAD